MNCRGPFNPGLNPGKLIVLTGSPGTAKSTTPAAIAQLEQWVYYEGDGFTLGSNPYLYPNENQVDARSDKPAVIGPGKAWEGFKNLWLNQEQLEAETTTDRSPTIRFDRLAAEYQEGQGEETGLWRMQLQRDGNVTSSARFLTTPSL